jgi:NAD(P)-dependent dehydrogenase (short-subunit alcohol dehydrogenase family)
VAIVTGAGSREDGIGNGRAAAILMARHGARVALIDAVPQWAERTHAMIAAEGNESLVVPADVTDPQACAQAVASAVQAWGRLDILVNNVGIGGPPGDAVEVDLAAWNHSLLVNVTSMMLMAKHAIPEMRKVGGGAIVNVASVAGLLGGHPSLLYPTSKGAVVNMTRAMASHHGHEGIRVNCICPGVVDTEMVRNYPALVETLKGIIALEHMAQPEQLADVMFFLLGPQAAYITGADLAVDGGVTGAGIYWPVGRSLGVL